MSQNHFPNDPHMGKIYAIDGHQWVVVDVWTDIAEKPDAPRHLTLDRVDGQDEGLHFSKAFADRTFPVVIP